MPQNIRNLSLIGPFGSGKTTLLEALLFAAGAIRAKGSVERGDTVSDFSPQERAMGHSLDVSVAHLDWAGATVNLLDTPGLPDFRGRALESLEAVETAALVIDAAHGVDNLARRLWRAAREDRRNLARMIVVNRTDAPEIDFEALLERIAEAFGPECLPINLPAPGGERVVDCFFAPDFDAATACSSVRRAHDAIVDQVVELDEALMERYLAQGESLGPDQLHDAFEAALRDGHLTPVCFVSARTGAGVRELLDVMARLMPDPTEGNLPPFVDGEGPDAKPIPVKPDPNAHVVAHVFEVSNDPFRGKLALFRVFQGTVRPGSLLYVGTDKKPFRVAHLLRLQGKETVEVDKGVPGDILAVSRVDEIHRDAVLHDSHDEDHFHLEPPRFPKPVYGLALVPRKHGDDQRLSDALHRILDEDPSLSVERDPETNETVLRGLGELHLKVILEQLATRFHVGVDTKRPSVPWREAIAGTGDARYRHKKQTGGAGQFGEVALRVEPLPRGAGVEFVDAVRGGAIPGQFMAAVEKGVQQALREGAIAGYPVHDVRVTVYDGKSHAVDSKEIAFVSAARQATLQALEQAKPFVLEPYMEVTMRVGQARIGDVTADVLARRGRVLGNEALPGGRAEIVATIPLDEMDNFEPRLKSLTGGDGSYTLAFSHYDEAPPATRAKLVEAWQARRKVPAEA
ncbi:MAG: elongation factor G [Myxococcota bacterium]